MQAVVQKLLAGGSVIFLVLILVNIWLFSTNRAMQVQVGERAQYIQESLTLEKVYQPLVRALAELAASRNDPQIKALLNQQGISFSVNPAAPKP